MHVVSLISLLNSILLAQDDAGGGNPASAMMPLLMFAVLGLLFYFMVVAPERRKQKDHRTLLDNLKKNDRVVTVGGVKGVVVNVSKDTGEVTVRIDENTGTKIHCDITAIAKVENDGDDKSSKSSKSSEGSK